MLIMVEEGLVVQYLEDIVKVSCSLNTFQLQLKVAKITQTKMTPFAKGIPEK